MRRSIRSKLMVIAVATTVMLLGNFAVPAAATQQDPVTAGYSLPGGGSVSWNFTLQSDEAGTTVEYELVEYGVNGPVVLDSGSIFSTYPYGENLVLDVNRNGTPAIAWSAIKPTHVDGNDRDILFVRANVRLALANGSVVVEEVDMGGPRVLLGSDANDLAPKVSISDKGQLTVAWLTDDDRVGRAVSLFRQYWRYDWFDVESLMGPPLTGRSSGEVRYDLYKLDGETRLRVFITYGDSKADVIDISSNTRNGTGDGAIWD